MAMADRTKIIIGLYAVAAIGALYYFRSKKQKEQQVAMSTVAMLPAMQTQQFAPGFKVYDKTPQAAPPLPTMDGTRGGITTPAGTYSWPMGLVWDWKYRTITNRSGKDALIGLPKGQTVVLPDGMYFDTITGAARVAIA